MYLGRISGGSNTHATSQHHGTALGRGDRFADDWDREREKHQKTLNGTRFTPSVSSHQEPTTENWPCVDNTSCEIQLSLVEQQQKLLNQKRQALAKSQMSSHTGLRNGHSDTWMHPVLSSLDNKPRDEKYVSANRTIHSTSQQEFLHGTDLYRGVGSHGGWSRSVDDFVSSQAHADVPAYNPALDIPADRTVLDKKHVGEREFDANEEQAAKKQKRLHHLRGCQKSGRLHRSCLVQYEIIVAP